MYSVADTQTYCIHSNNIFGRSYDSLTVAHLPLKARELMRNIHKRVFMTYLRMATNKESSVSNMIAVIRIY